MPIFEYACKQCRHCFERLVFAGAEITAECPQCGSQKVRKLVSCTRSPGKGIAAACNDYLSGGPS